MYNHQMKDCEVCGKYTYTTEVNHVHQGENTPCILERSVKEFYCRKGGYMNDHHSHDICIVDWRDKSGKCQKSCYSKYEQAEQKRYKKQLKEGKRLEEAQQEYDNYMGPKIQRHEEAFQEWENYWMNKSYDTYQRMLAKEYRANNSLCRKIGAYNKKYPKQKYVCEICGTTMKEEKLELFKLPNWEGWHQEIFGSCKECKLWLIEKHY